MEDSSISVWLRAGSLFVLIVLFQVFIAHAPSSSPPSSSSSTSSTNNANKSQSETQRRFQHALTGHAMVELSYMIPRIACIVLLLLAAFGMYILRTYFYETIFLKAFGPLLRPNEKRPNTLPGAFYFLLGTGLCVWLFSSSSNSTTTNNMTIPRYAVECLALADPMASWIGSTIKSPKITSSSSVAGCVACFITSWLVGCIMLDDPATSITVSNINNNFYMVVTCGAIGCTVAEGFMTWGNDNLTIPIVTAFAVDIATNGFRESIMFGQIFSSFVS
jgi:dolichol kinase